MVRLTQARQHLLNHKDRNDMNEALMELIDTVPKEARNVMTDFASTALLVGWKRTASLFEEVWNYVMLILKSTEQEKILAAKKKAQESIYAIVRKHVHIDTIEDFRKAISVWGDQPDDIPHLTKEERAKLGKEFLDNKNRSDVFKNVGL